MLCIYFSAVIEEVYPRHSEEFKSGPLPIGILSDLVRHF